MFDAIARPFGMLLMFIYDLVHNYGVALILVAIVIKIILLPFQMKGKRGMMRQARLQPLISELQKRHAGNKQKLNEEMAKFYKEEGVNPASGCLWNFIQMPIMIALFYAIRSPMTIMMGISRDLLEEGTGAIYLKLQELNFVESLTEFYREVDWAQFMSLPEHWGYFTQWEADGLRQMFFNLGPLNLAEIPQWQFLWTTDWSNSNIWVGGLLLFFLPIVSGGAQFISAAIMRKTSPQGSPEAAAGTMGKVMKFMPLMSVWFGFILPAALSLYWTMGTILQIGQDIWLTKKYTKILDAEDAEKSGMRKAREAEYEAKRLETERKKAEGTAEENLSTSKKKKKKGKKQGKKEKAAEWEKKNAPPVPDEEKYEPSRVGNRRYARGRAYDPDRYIDDSSDDVELDENDYDNNNDNDITDDVDLEVPADDVGHDDDDSEGEDIPSDDDLDGDDGLDFDDDEHDDDDFDDDVEHDDDVDNDTPDDPDAPNEPDTTPDSPYSEKFETKRFD